MSKYNLLDIHEGMGYKEFEDAKEADRLEAHPEKDTIKKIKAMMAKEKSVKEGDAVDLAIEASQEKAGIKEDKYDDIVNADDDIPADKKKAAALAYRKVDKGDSYEYATSHVDESFDSLAKKLDKQKGITKDEAGKIAGSIAAKKRAGAGKGPTAKQKKRMNEVRIDRDVAERIEGMLSIPLKRKFLDSFMDLWQDLIEEDPFYAEDVINHLNNEMHKEIGGYQVAGDRLAGLEEKDAVDIEENDGKKKMDEGVVKSIMQALRDDAKATNDEIKAYMTSLMRAGDEFDDIDDYVEDFKNYIADKSLQENFILQEHFKRFR
jgi:hypothetical protein